MILLFYHSQQKILIVDLLGHIWIGFNIAFFLSSHLLKDEFSVIFIVGIKENRPWQVNTIAVCSSSTVLPTRGGGVLVFLCLPEISKYIQIKNGWENLISSFKITERLCPFVSGYDVLCIRSCLLYSHGWSFVCCCSSKILIFICSTTSERDTCNSICGNLNVCIYVLGFQILISMILER